MSTSQTGAPLCHREEADSYDRVILRVNEDIRIIECKDGIQWIGQHRAGQRAGEPRWRNVWYHRTRDTLEAACQRSGAFLTDDQRAVIARLPSICSGGITLATLAKGGAA
jgi:hypothetical protein